MKLLISLSFLVLLTGCATASGVKNASIEEGVSRNFEAPFEEVKSAALESVQASSATVKDAYDSQYGYQIDFEERADLFSWGEIGRVLVLENQPNLTQVNVYSEKKAKYQLTGKDNEDFAFSIFMGIEQALIDE